MIYWTPENQTAIEKYIKATTQEEKNKIFNECLYTSIHLMCKQVLFNRNNVNEDDIQELLIFTIEKVLPKIKEDKLIAVQNFIWISINRRYITLYHSSKTKNKVNYESDVTTFDKYTTPDTTTDVEFNYILKEDTQLLREQIINEIDSRIEQQEVINKTKSIFLILLREHLIENDFDSSTFKEECTKRMKLKHKGQFNNIASSLGIRTKVFKEDNKNKLK